MVWWSENIFFLKPTTLVFLWSMHDSIPIIFFSNGIFLVTWDSKFTKIVPTFGWAGYKWHWKKAGSRGQKPKIDSFSSSKIKTTSFDTRPTSTSKVFNSTPHLITLASVHQPTQSDPTSTFLTRLLLSISNYTQQWCSVKNVAKYCLKRSLSPRTVRPPRDTVYIQ